MPALRGYADWKPKEETLYWVGKVRGVLDEYRDYLPITLRQIFYRLVAEHGFDKTEQAYNRLGKERRRRRKLSRRTSSPGSLRRRSRRNWTWGGTRSRSLGRKRTAK